MSQADACTSQAYALPHDITDWRMQLLHGLCCFDFVLDIPLSPATFLGMFLLCYSVWCPLIPLFPVAWVWRLFSLSFFDVYGLIHKFVEPKHSGHSNINLEKNNFLLLYFNHDLSGLTLTKFIHSSHCHLTVCHGVAEIKAEHHWPIKSQPNFGFKNFLMNTP
jgi:hypothetical protein